MLKRYQAYIADKPLQAWLHETVFLATLYGISSVIFYGISHEKFKPGILLLLTSFTVSFPTTKLVERLSPERRRKKPVSWRQETGIAIAGAIAALSGMGALCFLMYSKRAGIPVASDTGIIVLMGFSFSCLLSLALGYAVRHTRAGQIVLLISAAWLPLYFAIVSFGALVRGII